MPDFIIRFNFFKLREIVRNFELIRLVTMIISIFLPSMNKLFTPIIRETNHCDAKPSVDDQKWHFQTPKKVNASNLNTRRNF